MRFDIKKYKLRDRKCCKSYAYFPTKVEDIDGEEIYIWLEEYKQYKMYERTYGIIFEYGWTTYRKTVLEYKE